MTKTNGDDSTGPIFEITDLKYVTYGLTKREAFAATIAAGFAARDAVVSGTGNTNVDVQNTCGAIAALAVMTADALIKALNDGGGDDDSDN